MKILYSIGDIHGRLDLLGVLRRKIIKDAEEKEGPHKVIFLGDYVDRGPDGKGVLDYLMSEPFIGFEHIFLKGNHEDMLVDSLSGRNQDVVFFLANGGMQTVLSFGLQPMTLYANINPWVEAIDPYYDWLRRLHYYHAVEGWLFVHAGIDSRVPMASQDANTMMWIRDHFLNDETDFGFRVVHGHCPTKGEPEVKHNRINVDTGACWTHRLTAVCIDTNNNSEPYFLSTKITSKL